MRCSECGCVSRRAPGWIALRGRDPDDDDRLTADEVYVFCPVCAAREFSILLKTSANYI